MDFLSKFSEIRGIRERKDSLRQSSETKRAKKETALGKRGKEGMRGKEKKRGHRKKGGGGRVRSLGKQGRKKMAKGHRRRLTCHSRTRDSDSYGQMASSTIQKKLVVNVDNKHLTTQRAPRQLAIVDSRFKDTRGREYRFRPRRLRENGSKTKSTTEYS